MARRNLRKRYGRAGGGVSKCRKALKDLLEFTTSGRRYKTQNPYTIPEVSAGFEALGLNKYGESEK